MLFIASLSVMSCGHPAEETAPVDTRTTAFYSYPTVDQDSTLTALVQQFYEAAHGRNVPVSTRVKSIQVLDKIDSSNKEAVGTCLDDSVDRWIQIDQKYWNKADDNTKRTLVFHELGHCALGCGHAPDDAGHIMNPRVLPSQYVENRWEMLVDGLFNFCKGG
jgi:hypothetical protein